MTTSLPLAGLTLLIAFILAAWCAG